MRRLERPPAERYTEGGGSPAVAAAEPRRARGAAYGLVAAAGGAVVWLVAAGVIDLSGGLIVAAGVLGWVIGAAIRAGTWGGAIHAVDDRAGAIAAILGLVSWLGGSFLVYLYSLATLPASALTFAERLAAQPFVDWLGPQLLPLAPLELAAFALLGWYAARGGTPSG